MTAGWFVACRTAVTQSTLWTDPGRYGNLKCALGRRKIMSFHYTDLIMSAMASQITSLTIVYSTAHSGTADHIKHQRSASLTFVRGIHQWLVNSPHKRPGTRKMFIFDDVIMRDTRGRRLLAVNKRVTAYALGDILFYIDSWTQDGRLNDGFFSKLIFCCYLKFRGI